MGNNNKKAPKGAAVFMLIVFFGGVVMAIGGDVAGKQGLSIFGVVTAIGGTFLTIVISNVIANLKAPKIDKDGPHSFGSSEPLGKHAHKDPTELLEGKYKLRDFSYVIDRENALYDLFDEYQISMLKAEYERAAEPHWDKYAGEDWDDNLGAIDLLIDRYYKKLCMLTGRNAVVRDESDDEEADTEQDFTENADTANATASDTKEITEEKSQAASSLVSALNVAIDKKTEERKAYEAPAPITRAEPTLAPRASMAGGVKREVAPTATSDDDDSGKRATVGYKGIKKK